MTGHPAWPIMLARKNVNKETHVGEDRRSLSDSEVLALSMSDPQAFGIIVDRYQREFLRKAVRIADNKDDAEDIVQDVFVKIYKFGRRFKHQEGATFKSWAYTILTNTSFTYCKKKKRRQQFFMNADEDMLEMHSVSNAEFDRVLDVNQVVTAIAKIPAMLGRMLSLALAGKSQEEIAVLEGVPVGTVRTRLHRAKKALHEAMS